MSKHIISNIINKILRNQSYNTSLIHSPPSLSSFLHPIKLPLHSSGVQIIVMPPQNEHFSKVFLASDRISTRIRERFILHKELFNVWFKDHIQDYKFLDELHEQHRVLGQLAQRQVQEVTAQGWVVLQEL